VDPSKTCRKTHQSFVTVDVGEAQRAEKEEEEDRQLHDAVLPVRPSALTASRYCRLSSGRRLVHTPSWQKHRGSHQLGSTTCGTQARSHGAGMVRVAGARLLLDWMRSHGERRAPLWRRRRGGGGGVDGCGLGVEDNNFTKVSSWSDSPTYNDCCNTFPFKESILRMCCNCVGWMS